MLTSRRVSFLAPTALALVTLIGCNAKSPTGALPDLGSRPLGTHTAFAQAVDGLALPGVKVKGALSTQGDVLVLMLQTLQRNKEEVCRQDEIYLVAFGPTRGKAKSSFVFKGGDGSEKPLVEDLTDAGRYQVLQLLGVVDDATVRLVQRAMIVPANENGYHIYYPMTGVGEVTFSASINGSTASLTLQSVGCKA